MATDVVRLTAEERGKLTEMISTGRRAASMLTHARMLLKAEAHDEGPPWTDPQIAEALETRVATVHRVRPAFVEEGRAAALERKRPTGRQERQRDGTPAAPWIALACRAPPAGRTRWTRQGLAERLVAVHVVPAISAEGVRTTRQKTR